MSSSSPRALTELPEELLFTVVAFLPVDSFISIFCISSDFGVLASSDAFWNIIYTEQIAPSYASLISPPSVRHTFSSLPASSRVRSLITRTRHAIEILGHTPTVDPPSTLDSSETANLRGKIVLLGESAVGKSSLQKRYVRGEFFRHQESGGMAAFLTQRYTMNVDDNSLTFVGDIWDTAGQERYRSLAPMYYRYAIGYVFVFDLSSRKSFERVRAWEKEVVREAGPRPKLDEDGQLIPRNDADSNINTPISYILLGNKSDLMVDGEEEEEREEEQEEDSLSRYRRDRFAFGDYKEDMREREVTREDAESLMKEFARDGSFGRYFETSAKTGKNVAAAFHWLFRFILQTWAVGAGAVRQQREEALRIERKNQTQRSRCLK